VKTNKNTKAHRLAALRPDTDYVVKVAPIGVPFDENARTVEFRTGAFTSNNVLVLRVGSFFLCGFKETYLLPKVREDFFCASSEVVSNSGRRASK